MKCRPWRWLWGLFPLALVGFLTTVGEHGQVESDLTLRGERALSDAGLGWASVDFEGRDGVIRGQAPDASARARARGIVESLYGVRIVQNDAGLLAVVTPYTWSVSRNKGRIKLRGHAMRDADRDAIFGMVRVAFPQAEISNKIKLARGGPVKEPWLSGVSFALKQIGRLGSGTASLSDLAFSINGVASTSDNFVAINADLSNALPRGISLAENAVRAPRVDPYRTRFKRDGERFVLSGYVPDDGTRNRILNGLRAAAPTVEIIDNLGFGEGAPDGFEAAIMAAIEAAAGLDNGAVELNGARMSIGGHAGGQGEAEAIAERLSLSIGAGIKLDNKVTFRAAPPVARPFTLQVRAGEDAVVLSGHIPSEAARSRLIAQARARFPNREIRDDLRVASGVPVAEPVWMEQATRALDAVALLGNGQVRLQDRTLTIVGETSDAGLRQKAAARIGGASASGFAIEDRISLVEAREPDISLLITRAGNRVVLSGRVTDEATRAALTADARRLVPDAQIVDLTVLDGHASKRWSAAAARGLEMLGRLETGRMELSGTELTVSGIATRQHDIDLVRETVTAALPEGYRGREQLTLQPAKPAKSAAQIEQEAAAKRKRERIAKYRLTAEYNGAVLANWRKLDRAERASKALTDAERDVLTSPVSGTRNRLVLRGRIASEPARQRLTAAARSAFDVPIVDELRVIDGSADRSWEDAAVTGITELSRLRLGALELDQQGLTLYGDATTVDSATAVRRAIDAGSPARFDVNHRITAPRQLAAAEVEQALGDEEPVAAAECGNVMNSITRMKPILFEVESAQLGKEDRLILERIARIASKCTSARIRVRGHTDSSGPASYNQSLAEDRATTVVRFLTSRGIARKRLSARGFGEAQPLVSNRTEKGRRKNRRIEFVVVDK